MTRSSNLVSHASQKGALFCFDGHVKKISPTLFPSGALDCASSTHCLAFRGSEVERGIGDKPAVFYLVQQHLLTAPMMASISQFGHFLLHQPLPNPELFSI
jgi:hypothetical protein